MWTFKRQRSGNQKQYAEKVASCLYCISNELNVWVLNKHFSCPFISIAGFFSERLIIFQMGHSLGSGSEKAMILGKILSLACEYLFKSLELFISGLRMFVPELDPSYCFPFFLVYSVCKILFNITSLCTSTFVVFFIK